MKRGSGQEMEMRKKESNRRDECGQNMYGIVIMKHFTLHSLMYAKRISNLLYYKLLFL
jgi:hypothetical protein